MRAAALLLAALTAACGGANRAEREHLAQLRAICAGLTATSTTMDQAGGEFGTLALGLDDGCATGRVAPGGSCPSGAGVVLCRIVWVWQPVDGRLCSPVGNCLYQCEAYAPPEPGQTTITGAEIVCASISSGP